MLARALRLAADGRSRAQRTDRHMQQRPLGRSGLSIAPLVLGTNVFGWTADEATSFRLLDAFVDAGLNALDTADIYSRGCRPQRGKSETIIGKWLAAIRPSGTRC